MRGVPPHGQVFQILDRIENRRGGMADGRTGRYPFGKRLKALRLAAGMTQPELAQKAGPTKHAISILETGRQQPWWETACKLATAMGVSIAVFNEAETPDPPDLALL
jgi:DNA-binding XRE family transcriptional regulator